MWLGQKLSSRYIEIHLLRRMRDNFPRHSVSRQQSMHCRPWSELLKKTTHSSKIVTTCVPRLHALLHTTLCHRNASTSFYIFDTKDALASFIIFFYFYENDSSIINVIFGLLSPKSLNRCLWKAFLIKARTTSAIQIYLPFHDGSMFYAPYAGESSLHSWSSYLSPLKKEKHSRGESRVHSEEEWWRHSLNLRVIGYFYGDEGWLLKY